MPRPANERPPRRVVHEEVLELEANPAEIAPELRNERFSDRGLPDVLSPVVFVVDGPFGEERHHLVQVVAVEGSGESDDEVAERAHEASFDAAR